MLSLEKYEKGRSLKVIGFSPEFWSKCSDDSLHVLDRLCLTGNVLQYQPRGPSMHGRIRVQDGFGLNKLWHRPHKLGVQQVHGSQFHTQVRPALDNRARLHQHTAIFYNMHSEFQWRKHRQTPPTHPDFHSYQHMPFAVFMVSRDCLLLACCIFLPLSLPMFLPLPESSPSHPTST